MNGKPQTLERLSKMARDKDIYMEGRDAEELDLFEVQTLEQEAKIQGLYYLLRAQDLYQKQGKMESALERLKEDIVDLERNMDDKSQKQAQKKMLEYEEEVKTCSDMAVLNGDSKDTSPAKNSSKKNKGVSNGNL